MDKIKICEYCGKQFITKSLGNKCCSDECKKQRRNDIDREKHKTAKGNKNKKYKALCKHCGKEFSSNQPQAKFCCGKCRHKYRKKHYRITEPFICKYCGKEFHPKGYDRTTYCSRECAFADRVAKPKEKRKPICVICGKEFEGRLNSKYCSDECYEKYKKDKYLKYKNSDKYLSDLEKQRNNYKPKNIYTKICKYCGLEYKTSNNRSKYCSKKCATKSYNISESRREERRRYRARKVGAYIKPVNTMEIYKRDKGVCQICGKKVNKKLIYPHPMSMSLDHIIPLSEGGTHEPKNVQLTHFQCNSIKSNGTLEHGEQLRLC
jgi:hypothetical protein